MVEKREFVVEPGSGSTTALGYKKTDIWIAGHQVLMMLTGEANFGTFVHGESDTTHIAFGRHKLNATELSLTPLSSLLVQTTGCMVK
jgi:hypothetical protein